MREQRRVLIQNKKFYSNFLLYNFAATRPAVKTATARVTRPRPQPIAGTPPPDPNEKCDANIIQQTCNLFGLDLVS